MAEVTGIAYHARAAGNREWRDMLSAGRRDTRAYSHEEGSP